MESCQWQLMTLSMGICIIAFWRYSGREIISQLLQSVPSRKVARWRLDFHRITNMRYFLAIVLRQVWVDYLEMKIGKRGMASAIKMGYLRGPIYEVLEPIPIEMIVPSSFIQYG